MHTSSVIVLYLCVDTPNIQYTTYMLMTVMTFLPALPSTSSTLFNSFSYVLIFLPSSHVAAGPFLYTHMSA